MPLFEWDEILSIKIPSVDRQHKVLIGYINELYDNMQTGRINNSLIDFILKKLVGYTRTHFAYEEILFSTYKYPDQADHKLAHEKLLNKVVDFKTRFEKGEDVAVELLEFLKNWLTNHILKEDIAYSQHMIDNGVV
jgi:hemerythrin